MKPYQKHTYAKPCQFFFFYGCKIWKICRWGKNVQAVLMSIPQSGLPGSLKIRKILFIPLKLYFFFLFYFFFFFFFFVIWKWEVQGESKLHRCVFKFMTQVYCNLWGGLLLRCGYLLWFTSFLVINLWSTSMYMVLMAWMMKMKRRFSPAVSIRIIMIQMSMVRCLSLSVRIWMTRLLMSLDTCSKRREKTKAAS